MIQMLLIHQEASMHYNFIKFIDNFSFQLNHFILFLKPQLKFR